MNRLNIQNRTCLFSPSFSKQAADLAVKATEVFLNRLRADVGNQQFDRLLCITPNNAASKAALNDVLNGKRFRFFSPSVRASVKKNGSVWGKIKKFFQRLYRFIRLISEHNAIIDESMTKPTLDLSDKGVDVNDTTTFRGAPYLIGDKEL